MSDDEAACAPVRLPCQFGKPPTRVMTDDEARAHAGIRIECGRGLIHDGFTGLTRHADDGSLCAGPACPDHGHLRWMKL